MAKKRIKFYPPGSNEAIKHGCTCPVLDNEHGRGYMGGITDEDGNTLYVYSGGCKLHSKTLKVSGTKDTNKPVIEVDLVEEWARANCGMYSQTQDTITVDKSALRNLIRSYGDAMQILKHMEAKNADGK